MRIRQLTQSVSVTRLMDEPPYKSKAGKFPLRPIVGMRIRDDQRDLERSLN